MSDFGLILFFALLLAILLISFGFGSCGWKTKKIYRQVEFVEREKKRKKIATFWNGHDCMKMLLNTYILCKFQIWKKMFLMFKVKYEKNDF